MKISGATARRGRGACASTARPSAPPTGTSSPPSSRPRSPMNQPSVPRSVPGPRPCPPCGPRSTTRRARRARTAARRSRAARGRPPRRPPAGAATADALTPLRPPRERRREAGLALVRDAEGVDAPTASRARPSARSPAGWKMPVSCAGSPDSTPNGTMSSISKSTSSPILTRVRQAVLAHLDRRALDAEVLADQRAERLHRAAERAGEHAAELLRLLVGRAGVDEHAEPPVAVGHHLRRVGDRGDREAADVRALDVSPA